MALVECTECGHDVSTRADSCPNCGAPVERGLSGPAGCLRMLAIIFAACLALVFILLFVELDTGSSATDSRPKTQEELRKEQIERQFSPWNGSHAGLTEIIKKSMNDPRSYEHVETVYWDMGDHLVVRTTYRGKNAFGGTVKDWVKAKVDLNGNVLQIMEQGP